MCALQFDQRKSGIPLIGEIPWGSHFCQFYQSEADLLEIMVPYFQAGLEGNEYCVWVISDPLTAESAKAALQKSVPRLDEHLHRGQLEFVSPEKWYFGGTGVSPVIRATGETPVPHNANSSETGGPIVAGLDRAIVRGFDGLRIACNAIPQPAGTGNSICAVIESIGQYNALGLFAYPRAGFDAIGLMDVVKQHRFALIRNSGRWDIIQSSEAQIAKDSLKRSEEKLQSLFSHMSEGFAWHRIVLDDAGKPCDYVFLEVNESFERLTGLNGKAIIGKRATQALPGIEHDPIDWIGKYGQVALTGQPIQFESFSSILNKWFSVSAFSPHKGFFGVTFSDISDRKNTAEALVRERVNLQAIFDMVNVGMLLIGEGGVVTRINNTVSRWIGKDLAARLNAQPGDVVGCIHALSESKGCGHSAHCLSCPIRSAFEAAMRTGQPVHGVETEVILSISGDEVGLWLEISADPLDLDGKRHVILAMNNITARKQAEDALRRQREWLRVTLTSIGDAVIAGDMSGRVTFLNPIAEELTGWSSNAALGQPIQQVFRIINEATGEPAEDIAARVLRECRVITLANHTALIARDGRSVPIEDSAAPIMDNTGKLTGVVVVFHDVTPKRRAQIALRQSEERLALAQRAGGIGVLDWDLASGRTICTAELENIFGLPAESTEGTYAGWARQVHPEDLPRIEALFKNWMDSTRQDERWQYRIARPDGEERWISACGRLIRDLDSKALRMISTHVDITDMKRTEIQLLQQARALAEADRHKDEFLAMLAHELRNPLAPIRYAVQILGALGPRESHLQRQREIIDRQVNHMGRLLDDLLDVSRISRGKIRLQKERLDLRVVLDQALEVARPQLNEHHHELICDRCPMPLWLEGDNTRLEQILRNLLSNAAKYTPDGGRIHVSLECGSPGASEGSASFAIIRVRDSGVGIAPEMLPRVFEIFSQADQTLDRSQGGLGIGLSMVKNLVELHGGSVHAASAGLGKGSEFMLRLPLLAESEVSAPPAPSAERGAPKIEPQHDEGIKVLVVDDNVDSACSLGELLHLWGYTVHVAHNGLDAIQAALEFQPDVVLLDIGLPGMNGYEVARHLRAEAALEGIELVAVTGYGMEEDRRHAAQAGFGRHFTKPIDLKALRQMLTQLQKIEKA